MKENGIEVLLSVMAYHSNYPIVFEVKEGKQIESGRHYRTVKLPMKDENYAQTLEQLAIEDPDYNELLMTMGVVDEKIGMDAKQLHVNMVKYLATHEIEYCNDLKNENWLIKFPEQILQTNLKSYPQLLDSTYHFVNRFYTQNFLNRLRKIGERKTKQLECAYNPMRNH